MIIELRGVEFINKGAELMLRAITDQIAEQIPEALFVMDRGHRAPAEKLRANNIFVKLNGQRYSKLGRYVPKFVRRQFKYILDSEISVVIDGSGFAFGDQWGADYAHQRLGGRIIKWKQQGKKVILLPQAFGPFQQPELRETMNKILYHADLVFAREPQSYQYLQEVSTTSNFQLAPDFTNLIKGRIPADFDAELHQVAIIPNYKMIEKTENGRGIYQEFLLTTIQTVQELGLRPYFLIHEGKNDLTIAERINSILDKPLPVVANDDSLMIKGIISSAYFVVCSRFHGVVSALSQGVPCIATMWSHKYEMLLKEYDYDEGLIRDLSDHSNTKKLVCKIAEPEVNKAISRKLKNSSEIQKERSLKMWEAVFEVIKN